MTKLLIDEDENSLTLIDSENERKIDLFSEEAFSLLSHHWVRLGIQKKYSYMFSWMGRPVIQLPQDLIRLQEIIYQVQPDVIIETGVAHGGSLAFSASLCKTIEKGRVIGVDVHIRPHNREALESHKLFSYLTLIEGSSTDPTVIEKVKSLIAPKETVLVILDSNHTKNHVLKELQLYGELVTPGSYLIVADGVMENFPNLPGTKRNWQGDSPLAAVREFLSTSSQFEAVDPPLPFNESFLEKAEITYFTGGWLRKKGAA